MKAVPKKIQQSVFGVLLFCVIALLASSCTRAYVQNRINDALDCLEPGITYSEKPGLVIFTDCFSMLPLGYGSVEGVKIGIGNRQVGRLNWIHESWGFFLLAGEYRQGVGQFNPRDPHQARKDQINETTWPTYTLGLVGLMADPNPRPLPAFLECDKTIHLGWIGIALKYRYADFADFLLGFTTLDILGDDLEADADEAASVPVAKPAPVRAPAPIRASGAPAGLPPVQPPAAPQAK
ncbi:MAG: hypothetical protein N3D11_04000 [Candidatus Sumerlaeia bacterium]|nr:hypothetical protein [Candidatus Sumerlaeia bacterium]